MRFEILLPRGGRRPAQAEGQRTVSGKGSSRDPFEHETNKTSRSRIKRLRGMTRPQYRLRVEEFGVFYDVSGSAVEVLAIVPKRRLSHG